MKILLSFLATVLFFVMLATLFILSVYVPMLIPVLVFVLMAAITWGVVHSVMFHD